MNEKTRKSCEHGPENGKPKFNQTKRKSDKGGSARVNCHIIIPSKTTLPYINRDFKLSVLSLGHFISFSFAAEEPKGVNYFPSRANDQFEKRCYR